MSARTHQGMSPRSGYARFVQRVGILNAVARRGLAALAVVCGLAAVTACSSASPEVAHTADSSGSLDAWVTEVLTCLHDSGWPDAKLTGDGGGIEVPSLTHSQAGSFSTTRSECEQKAGPQPFSNELSQTQLSQLYDHLVASVECIEAEGFTVTAGPPPSQATFMDEYLSGSAPWSPFVGLDSQVADSGAWDHLVAACPQTPW